MALLTLTTACTKKTAVVSTPSHTDTSIHHAELLHLQQLDHGRSLCQILDPWRSGRQIAQYLLVPSNDSEWNDQQQASYDEEFGSSQLLRTPLQHMALTTGCHAWLLHELEALQQVAVMCDTAYVTSAEVREWLHTHEVKDGGSATAPNAEVLLQAGCDAIWVSPYENLSLNALEQIDIPTIYCADYMENSPLARAEWMKFYGMLVGKEAEADSLFTVVGERYDSLCALTDTLPHRPRLLAELPYGPTWYVPGGASTSAQLYEDAGFDYYWKDDAHAGSLSLSLEAVLAKAGDCDRWYFKYMDYACDWDYDTFAKQNPYFAKFRAYQSGELWGCNTAHSDLFDVTPFRPDWLLESIRNHDERFFQRLKR